MKWFKKIILFLKKSKSKIPDQKFMKIGEYQFQNLMLSRVPCLILDLRVTEADKPQIQRSYKVIDENALAFVRQQTSDVQHPILLISDDGSVAIKVAEQLSNAKYFNVVVLEGGVRALSEQAKAQLPPN